MKRRMRVTGGGALERWEPAPPSPRAMEAAEEQAPGAGEDTGRCTEEVARAAEVPACVAEVSRSATVAM
jgi:hypothetical protein